MKMEPKSADKNANLAKAQQPRKSWGAALLSKFGIGQKKYQSTKTKKLPKDFANLVLEKEMKIDSGMFDIGTVNSLMALYSQAVEYYSGMNDEKYIYFTERIQNILVRPEILKLMKDVNDGNALGLSSSGIDPDSAGRKGKKHRDVTPDSALKVGIQGQLDRKKARAEKLAAAV